MGRRIAHQRGIVLGFLMAPLGLGSGIAAIAR